MIVEQDSEVRVASVRHELIGDVRNMITGFLLNNRIELSTGSRDDVGRISSRWAWIPLKGRNDIDDARDRCLLYQCDRARQVWIDQS